MNSESELQAAQVIWRPADNIGYYCEGLGPGDGCETDIVTVAMVPFDFGQRIPFRFCDPHARERGWDGEYDD